MSETQAAEKPASLPEDILDFLVEFARAAQRFGMYPAGHPARETTSRQLSERLIVLISARGVLRLDIGQDRLTINGVETDPQNALLTAFAGRLYEHQLIGMVFNQGIEEAEIAELLSAVSIRVGKTGEPLGAEPPEKLDRWPNITIEPVPYDSLSLSRGHTTTEEEIEGKRQGTTTRPEKPAAVEQDTGPSSPFDIVLKQDRGDKGDTLTEAMAGLGEGDETDHEVVRQRVSRLILKLDPDTLRHLTEALPDEMQSEGIENAISHAVSEFVRAAGDDKADEHSVSMLKLLTKLGMRGDVPAEADDPVSEELLGHLVERLSKQWQLDDPTPDEYKAQLDSFSQEAPILATAPMWLEEPKAERVVQMSLEIDVSGPTVEQAVTSMIEEGELGKVIGLLEDAPEDSTSVDTLWEIAAGPDTVRLLVTGEPPDFNTLDKLLPKLGSDSAGPMLDALVESKSSTTRKGLIERLVKMGSKAGPAVVERLSSESGDVRRIMLVILKYLPSLPNGFSPESYMTDPVRGVRLEAMKLALHKAANPEDIILMAIKDSDQQIVELGLAAAATNCPPAIVSEIITIVRDTGAAPTIRMAGIRALAPSKSEDALNALLEMTWTRKWIVLRRLAPKSSEMLEALAVLARSWRDNPGVHHILEAAAKNKDAQIRAVVRSREKSQ